MTKTSKKNEPGPVSENTINAFTSMWGAYPSPVMLLKANREIVAANDAALKMGIPLGIKCFSLTGNSGACEHCQAKEALNGESASRLTGWSDKLNIFSDTYWIPVKGEKGLFVHFGNNITDWVKEDLINKKG